MIKKIIHNIIIKEENNLLFFKNEIIFLSHSLYIKLNKYNIFIILLFY